MNFLTQIPYINFHKELNDQQYKAITVPSLPTLIIAGAGSGKTRTLVYRFAYLLTQGVKPWEILLLTFTNKAAQEMLNRIENLTKIPKNLFFGGTFHSIGQRIIRLHGASIGIKKNYTILDKKDTEFLLDQVVKNIDKNYLKHKTYPKNKILYELISYKRNTCNTIRQIIENRYPFFKNLSLKIEKFYEEYKACKLEQQVVDYDDLLEYWVQIFQEFPSLKEKYQKQFKHILIDEYQDTNSLQFKIINLLANNNQIMAVGDDAQCIYTWRGANFDNILKFSKIYPKAKICKIEINYRSTPEILNFANSIFNNHNKRSVYEKKLRSIRKSNKMPFVIYAQDTYKQAKIILTYIKKFVNKGRNLSDIAILYRAHYQAMEMQVELSRNNIPFSITSGVRFFEQSHIRDLIAFLRFVFNFQDEMAFIRIIQLLPKIGPKTAKKIYQTACTLSKQNEILFANILNHKKIISKIPKPSIAIWRQLTSSWQSIQTLKASQPEKIVYTAINSWYGDYLKEIYLNWESRKEDLNSVINFATNYNSIIEMLTQIALLTTEISDQSKKSELDGNLIRMTTIHQSKGLEFSTVFIIGLAEGLFPSKRAIDIQELSEERRLFYVSVTRAKDELYLVYPMTILQKGSAHKTKISRFIEEIPSFYYKKLKNL